MLRSLFHRTAFWNPSAPFTTYRYGWNAASVIALPPLRVFMTAFTSIPTVIGVPGLGYSVPLVPLAGLSASISIPHEAMCMMPLRWPSSRFSESDG